MAGAEQPLLLAIQLALKEKKTGSAPKLEHLAVAVKLARNEALVAGTECKAAGFTSSGTRKTIIGYKNGILAKRLLDVSSTGLPAAPPEAALHVAAQAPQLQPALHVKPAWIRKHAPGLHDFEASALRYEGSRATRVLRARSSSRAAAFSEITVVYDIPAAGASMDAVAKRDRYREEKAIRELDEAAGAAHRARKAQERHETRVLQAAVAETMEALVASVCEQACAWEPAEPPGLVAGDWAWLPPANGEGPRLLRIDARFRNGVADITPYNIGTGEFDADAVRLDAAAASTLLSIDAPSPRWVGQRVRVRHVCRAWAHVQDAYGTLGIYCRDVWPYCGPLDLAELGTDLYAQAIYTQAALHPETALRWRSDPASVLWYRDRERSRWLDKLWELRGVDGYEHGLCDLARIERLDFTTHVYVKLATCDEECELGAPWTVGVADVVLFNPQTMEYDGLRLTSVPLHNICSLGFGWALAEARAGALSALVPLISLHSNQDGEHASTSESSSDADSEDEVFYDCLEHLPTSHSLSPADFQALLRRVDTADSAHEIVACVAEVEGLQSLQAAISAREHTIASLREIRERVQEQWVQQQVRHAHHMYDGDGSPPSSKELTQRARLLLYDRMGMAGSKHYTTIPASRHIVCGTLDGSVSYGEDALPSMSMLYG